MKTFEVKLGDGRTVEIDAPDAQTAAKVAARYERKKPTTAYGKAMQRVEKRDAFRRENNERFGGGIASTLDDLAGQVARNTGAFDEVAGGINYAMQGGENLVRRMTGKPIEIPAAVAGKAAMDFERRERARVAQERPMLNTAASIGTIVTSARPTGAAMFSNPVKAGAAAAAQNAPFALARQEGNLAERLPGAAKETALVAGTAGLMTAGANKLAAGASRARAKPSAARQLSQQGVELTPGQMMGGVAQRAEDAATSVPILGDAIREARIRGVESFDRAALGRTLDPIGETMPATVDVGRDGVRHAAERISNAYEKALTGVRVAPDSQLSQEFLSVANTPNLTAAQRESLDTIMGDMSSRFATAVDGDAWKVIDSDLGKAIRAADNASASQPGGTILKDALQRLRDAHLGVLQRQNPEAFQAVRAADAATANLARIRQASQYTGTSARGGVFTPADLNRAVQGMDTSAGNRAFAQGDALLQDLTEPAMQVLPQTVPDSGTPFRSLMTAGGLTGGVAVGVSPTAAAAGLGGLMTGAGVYSRPAQAALNAIYRAASPGQASAALAQLQALAARDPAIVPLYTDAAAYLGLPVERPVAVGMQ